jgi:hypothetical protein
MDFDKRMDKKPPFCFFPAPGTAHATMTRRCRVGFSWWGGARGVPGRVAARQRNGKLKIEN